MRLTFAAVATIACLIGAASLVRAQEQTGAIEPAAEAEVFEVVGLAPSDQLNLRATASANGMLIARVPAGSLLRNHGCAEVGGNRWCKVSDYDNPTVMGWAAERYLQSAQAAFTEAAEEPIADEPGADAGEIIAPIEGENAPR